MIEHEKITGMPFDRIMVFPQGKFSNEALAALKNNNYLAAVNTEAKPIDGPLTFNFPLFLRTKPEDIKDRISDPTFIVLHHEYFKHGYEKLTDVVKEINARNKYVKWDSVGNIIRQYVSVKEDSPHDSVDVDLSGLKYHGYKESAKICMRRYASELRDNYLSKNDFMLNCTRKVLDTLKNSNC